MDDMKDMDEDIIEQHENLFDQIRNSNDSGSRTYNY